MKIFKYLMSRVAWLYVGGLLGTLSFIAPYALVWGINSSTIKDLLC